MEKRAQHYNFIAGNVRYPVLAKLIKSNIKYKNMATISGLKWIWTLCFICVFNEMNKRAEEK